MAAIRRSTTCKPTTCQPTTLAPQMPRSRRPLSAESRSVVRRDGSSPTWRRWAWALVAIGIAASNPAKLLPGRWGTAGARVWAQESPGTPTPSGPAASSPSATGGANSGLAVVDAIERQVVDAIARSERSVVAISRQRRTGRTPSGVGQNGAAQDDDRRDDRGADPDNRLENARDDDQGLLIPERTPDDPDFVPVDYATGVVIDRQGLILTAYHALGDVRQSRYWVTIQRRPYEATIRAADPWLDLAVLKIAADQLEPIKWGDAKDLRRGQFVLSLGNPLAIARDGHPSATWGIVSNLARRAPPPGDERRRTTSSGETIHHYGTLIQTDVRLPLGTSGGALLNLRGEMIGLTTALAALDGNEMAAGFAIPVDETFRRTVETLKAGRKAEYGFLGVAPELLPLEDRQAGAQGVLVRRSVPGSPAAKAGLLPDDLITHVAGTPIVDSADLIRELGRWPADSKVPLFVTRHSGSRAVKPKTLTISVELSKKFVGGSRLPISETPDPTWRGLSVDYATAVPRFEQRAREMDPEGCVAITAVEHDSPAWKAGIRVGSFISHVGNRRVSRPQDFFAAVADRTDSVELRVALGDGKSEPRRISE